MSREDAIDLVLAIEKALSPQDREALLKAAMRNNPWVRGAQVADVLDIAYDADAFLSRSEPFWAKYSEHLKADPKRTLAISYALIAAVYLERDDAWVLDLAAKVS